MKKGLNILRIVVATILLVAGLYLIFNKQITYALINHSQKTELSKKIEGSKHSSQADFDFENVKSLDNQTTVKSLSDDAAVIGKIAIPDLKIKLPIYEGLSNYGLAKGAGTMKAGEQMGEGNYSLAGHHMDDINVLFGQLENAKPGMKVYLTDGKKVYIYKITEKKIITKYEVNYLDDVPDQKLLTLITCAEGGKTRYMVRGVLEKTMKLTGKTEHKLFL
ncbi:class A sortase [Ligilactobacillus equi]|uniref:Sortase n=1 Tax=Ligilactobacillus equi DSM 15833 = JCM 10991 TaxID=1423740 RepID=A0A0R1TLI6_9LACO|nr:class A sortase [Ligilactobacillus equi]KRL79475.1 sortase [Ligilactobacillus equi DSM 15833 = JCM 10991]MCQ2556536.1 class A sortase [Ligilactobacillus sp.]